MARVMNCSTKPMAVRVRGKDPSTSGQMEVRWPAPAITLPPRAPVTLRDGQATLLVERWGKAGIILIGDDETDEAALLRGMTARYNMLLARCTAYRDDQARRRAAGLEIRLPTAAERAMRAEMKVLGDEVVARDPLVREALPAPIGPGEASMESMTEALREFGIDPKAASIPGLDDLTEEPAF